MSAVTLEVTGLGRRFGRAWALRDVNLRTGVGITGLLGPNGAGKTTLLRIVATVLPPDQGSVRFAGRDPARPAERLEIRRRLGYLPQEPGFHRHFTVFEFVDYVAILKEMTDRRSRHDEVRRVLALVGLSEAAGKRIGALSGGMRRRVALAQALLRRPELLVLDEPTAGLDPEQRLRFRELVSSLGNEHTVLLATHMAEDVAALCQRVVVIHEGVVRFDGPPAALCELARDHVWLADAPDPDARLSWRTGDGHHRHIGDPPPGAQLIEPALEDAYLLLVGARDAEEAAA